MALTDNVAQYYSGDTVDDIYEIISIFDEWSTRNRLETGVSEERVLPSMELEDDLLLTPVDNPRLTNAGGTGTFDARLLSVDELMVLFKLTPTDWKDNFPVFQPSGSSIDLMMNPDILDVVLRLIKNKVSSNVGKMAMQGDDTLISPSQIRFTDGLLIKIDADADVVDVANQGVITIANALDVLALVEEAVPDEIANETDKVKIYTNVADYKLINRANVLTQQNGTVLTTAKAKQSNLGYEIVPMVSVPKNRIVAMVATMGEDSNFVRGTWFENDQENLLLYREQPADKDWLVCMRAHLGFQYRTGKHIVSYKGV